jgi:hypothetical protein
MRIVFNDVKACKHQICTYERVLSNKIVDSSYYEQRYSLVLEFPNIRQEFNVIRFVVTYSLSLYESYIKIV